MRVDVVHQLRPPPQLRVVPSSVAPYRFYLLWHDAETASSLQCVLIYASISLFFMTFLSRGHLRLCAGDLSAARIRAFGTGVVERLASHRSYPSGPSLSASYPCEHRHRRGFSVFRSDGARRSGGRLLVRHRDTVSRSRRNRPPLGAATSSKDSQCPPQQSSSNRPNIGIACSRRRPVSP